MSLYCLVEMLAHKILLVPASAQHNSLVYQSIVTELGTCTSGPVRNMDLSLPSTLLHSSFGWTRFQSDQNNFLEYASKIGKLHTYSQSLLLQVIMKYFPRSHFTHFPKWHLSWMDEPLYFLIKLDTPKLQNLKKFFRIYYFPMT